ncbi:glycosyltransferase [Bacillus sp. 31A1R]|uniref:Glycosyltransferase n=1 Tax=Robertmurraya mangrovi TaxID=3098077 RepID=A0ABU5ITG2_9BACI|nr:glycosyltransferase [Bacillus sp. 31A1R]MDZ5470442.1 glycosyltransferase [Bacillus sp. 31A1R]
MRRKIMFIVPSLRGGGAEKVMVTLLKHINRQKFEVLLVLLTIEGEYMNQVPPDVRIIDLGTNRVRHSLFSLYKIIGKEKPDIVFSTQGHLNLGVIALKPFIGKDIKIVVREANTLSELIKYSSKRWMWIFIYKNLYKKADLVICQSNYMLQDLIKHFKLPTQKLVQVYNPVDFENICYFANRDENPFKGKETLNIVSIGRLSHQKGYDRLIRSFPQLLELKPEATLWIIGKGPLNEELVQIRDELGLTDKVYFKDFQENPYKWLKHADLFVLSSYYEGLPNILLEAIACSCPVIALHHPGGTHEIMEITNQLERYIPDFDWKESWFNRPDVDCKELLFEEFNVERVVNKYEKIFENL